MGNNVEVAIKNFEVAKKDVETCQKSIIELQRKCDELQESLPSLSREIENAERAKTAALDAFALNSDEKSGDRLKRARTAYDQTVKQQAETNELVEATFRAVKKQEAELIRLNEACSQSKRAVWAAIADDLRLKIPAEMIEIIKKYALVNFTQLGGSYDFCLRSIFPQPGHGEGIEILQEFREKYQID